MRISPTLRQMQCFMAVARLGSFSRAAHELGMSQSALSQSVQQLEYLLDVVLLDRSRRTVVVTPAGELLILRLEKIFRDLGEALEDVRCEANEDEGAVSVACMSTVATLLIPPAVRTFKQEYPKVAVSIRDENVEGILDQVKSGEADFAITCLFSDDRDIEFQPILRDRFRFVCHKDHPYGTRKALKWHELLQTNLVVMSKGTGVRQLIERSLKDSRVLESAKYEVSRVPSVLKIVEEGGISSILPALTLATLSQDSALTHCPMTDPEIHREVGIISKRGATLTTLAEKFRQHFLVSLYSGNHLSHMPDIELIKPPERWERSRTA